MTRNEIVVPDANRKAVTSYVLARLSNKLDEDSVDALKLCIGEACQNVHRHSADKVAYVKVECEKHGMTVEIADKGPGFDVDSLPVPVLGQMGGYGVNIIRTHFGMDSVKSVIGEGTTVTLKVTF